MSFNRRLTGFERAMNEKMAMAELDLDQNGIVTKDEYLTVLLMRMNSVSGSTVRRLMALFDEIDADRDGIINNEDLRAKLRDLRK